MIEIIGPALSQWDTGRSVKVTDIEADYVHFANKGDAKAVIMELVDSQAKIPDYLFQTGKQLCVYAVKDGVTVESKVFYIKTRERPENYVYEDDQRNYIYELISKAETAIEGAYSAYENANHAVEAANTAIVSANVAVENANESADSAKQAAKNANETADSAKQAAKNANDAADKANHAAKDAVKTVNGVSPDENGNVEITIPDSGQNMNPVAKTEDMTQPVGVDEDGRLWTAPTAGNGSAEDEAGDILLGTLPYTISESNCYLLSETNATISTGEGAAQLLDFDVTEPYIGDTTYNGAAFEKLGKNTLKIGFANVARNASVFFQPNWESGKTYTIVGKLIDKTSDIANNNIPFIRINHAGNFVQLTLKTDGTLSFKTFTADDTTESAFAAMKTVSATYVAGETYATIAVYIYEGEHTELPTGATFDILAGEKYPTDGYMGATLSAVSGGPVQVYKTNTAGAEGETDNGGVIFFGDSVLHYSDVVSRYAAKTGKPTLSCAVGGTRMSASRDSSNAYYPLDMANIADAIASGDFSAQLGSGVATAGFTTLASANIANYKAIILEFGTNDFSAKVPFEGDDATSIAGAVRHILTTILTKYPNMRIVVLSTLQYVTLGTGTESGVPTHDDGTVWQMNEVIRDVCESDEFCVPWVDMYHAFGQNGITRNTLNSDGVHLTSPNGAKRYADILTGKLNTLGI